MSKKKFSGNIGGKGYYIALILCAAAIGISGYLYYRNVNDDQTALSNDATQPVAAVQEDGVEAAVTEPASQPSVPSETVAPQATKPAAVWPVKGQTVMEYAVETLAYNQTTRDWRTHDGVDIAADAGSKVCAAADGEVYSVYEDEVMGTTVVLVHSGGYTTRYASLAQEVTVSAGDKVTAGQTIGYVGATALLESGIGEHVHFSVSCNGQRVDPAEFLEQE